MHKIKIPNTTGRAIIFITIEYLYFLKILKTKFVIPTQNKIENK